MAVYESLVIDLNMYESTGFDKLVMSIGGAYRNVADLKVSIGEVWKDVSAVYVCIGGVWKTV